MHQVTFAGEDSFRGHHAPLFWYPKETVRRSTTPTPPSPRTSRKPSSQGESTIRSSSTAPSKTTSVTSQRNWSCSGSRLKTATSPSWWRRHTEKIATKNWFRAGTFPSSKGIFSVSGATRCCRGGASPWRKTRGFLRLSSIPTTETLLIFTFTSIWSRLQKSSLI